MHILTHGDHRPSLPQRQGPSEVARAGDRSHREACLGFTIVEAILVMAIAAALLVVIVPMLSSARSAVVRVGEADRIRLTMIDFFQWSADHQGQMPNVGLPGDPGAAWFYGATPPTVAASMYPGQTVMWPRVLERWKGGCAGHWHASTGPNMLGTGYSAEHYPADQWCSLPTRIEYSLTMMTRAELWDRAPYMTYAQAAPFFTMVRLEQISHPAAKGVVVHRADKAERSARAGQTWFVGFADGSASARDPATARRTGISPFTPQRLAGIPVLETELGFLGADF